MKTRHPTPKDIQELLAFLPVISAPDFVPVKDWDLDTNNMFPSPDYDPLLLDFILVINKPCWMDYDYGAHPVVLAGPGPDFPANADCPPCGPPCPSASASTASATAPWAAPLSPA